MTSKTQVKLGLPKGSLQEATIALMKKAGFSIHISARSYYPTIDDERFSCVLIRAQEIPRYVAMGVLDLGLTGLDWIVENGVRDQVKEICQLVYAKQEMRPVRWVLAARPDSGIRGPKDLEGKRIATELVNVTKQYLQEHNVKANVEFSWGATEAKIPELADAIIEVTESGTTLRAHGLEIYDTVLESTTRLIANPAAYQDETKREYIDSLALLLQGALRAADRVGLKLNVKKSDLQAVLSILPAMRRPTISELATNGGGEWVAVETIIFEREARELIPQLKRAGGEGIVEYPLNKVIP